MTELHKITRQIYAKQHKRIVKDDCAFRRHKNLFSSDAFGVVDESWFEGKNALDIGCGNIGALTAQLINLGCKKVCCIDIGTDWILELQSSLKYLGVPENKTEMKHGDHLDIPYEDGSFDFVASNGVLIHLEDMSDILKGFGEGARKTKRGGWYYTTYGPCGGLMQGVIFPAIRQYYNENKQFQMFIDSINTALLHSIPCLPVGHA